jgi:NAD(P)-dependent dehydrogenase (short-subunit alcohol dehydrogenase family)
MYNLTGSVALVTGASRGLGKQFALALSSAGADLAVTSRNIDRLNEIVTTLQNENRRVLPVELDVTDLTSIQQAVKKIRSHFGKIDVLVNNAGVNIRKPALEMSWDDWNTVLDTNLRGSFFVAQEVAKTMIDHGYGRIINIGSVTSVFGYAGITPYCASRGGVKQMTMSLADEWGASGITVNCLAPGWFETEQNRELYKNAQWVDYLTDRIPLKRCGKPSDLDGAILFLASEESRYITGQTLLVDGGISTGATKATLN